MTLRIKQHVYFAFRSSVTSAAQMSEYIGLPADAVLVRGSRRDDPPVPVQHSWKITSADPQLTIDEQLEVLVDRLRPCRDAACTLANDLTAREGSSAGAASTIVRELDDPEGEAGESQHWLLGWGLSTEVVRLALDTGATIDVDEYGQDRLRDYPTDPRSLRLGLRRLFPRTASRRRRRRESRSCTSSLPSPMHTDTDNGGRAALAASRPAQR